MFDDDDEDFGFNEDDFDSEAYKREQERIHNLPVFVKAKEIAHITQAICDSIKAERDLLGVRDAMQENAFLLGAKIAGAEGGDLYTLRMESAVIIKIHARELLTQTTLCKMEELVDEKYLQLLRDEIDNFRLLFIDWVNGFDRTNDVPDDWGLFYS
ncbi:hypothetical protein [Solitalea canadensis]|uniref:Uncharacterized protein n=1 Tax=Solitalea canadensis (strain ATCC 29591 / DSM 3403 / JCM 21819 / LMG 8368 / NBRC 15130 / NCIMB 12057 / USAM 9D) TaxID=929556 RepID=H8KPD4_SOLCM|nr:hypothetical protein [Solitalea canadensis]AFD05832.1 hypothetical protein Solca_0707 [Solitalea canadensis DSM 3403]